MAKVWSAVGAISSYTLSIASPNQRSVLAAEATSTLRLAVIGLPMSNVSNSANSSLFFNTKSAKRIMVCLRSFGDKPAQRLSLKAARAAATAKSISAALPLATSVSLRLSIGEKHSKVALSAALMRLPLMKARPSIFSALARVCQSIFTLASIFTAPPWRCI